MWSFLFLLLFIPLGSHAGDTPGKELLTYFSSNCRSQGEWSRAALADSMALIETLRSLGDDPDCRSVGGAVAQLSMLNHSILKLHTVSDTQSAMAQINFQEQELLVQLSQTSDPQVGDEISSYLRTLQLQRASLLGQQESQRELSGPDKVEAMTRVVQIANTAFAQVAQNKKCLAKNPNILNTATSIVSAVGATVSVVNPVLGLGLSAGATFLGETVESLRRGNVNRQIRRLSDTTVALEAYKCALETMSDRWCQMRDAESFLNFKAQQRLQRPMEQKLSSAIRLNDREIPVLLDWLNQIRSGVTPMTSSDAGRQSMVFMREAILRSLEANGKGLIEENRSIFNSYSEPEEREERWKFLRSLLLRLAPQEQHGGMRGSTDVSNPMNDVVQPGYAPYFLLGLAENHPGIKDQNGSFLDIQSWEKPADFNPDLKLVKKSFESWVTQTRNRINREMNQVLQPDPLQVLASSFDRAGNRWKLSPVDSLKNLIVFLKANPLSDSDLAFDKIYTDTLKKLEDIYETLQDSIAVTHTKKDTAVEKIFSIAQLQYGTVVLQARLDLIVRLSLMEFLRSSSSQDQVLVAQLLASERFSETISRMSGTDNLSSIRADIQRAQPITISNLNSFIHLFGKNINSILKKLEKEERGSQGTIAKAKRYARTELCFLLLSVPNAPRTINTKYCEGLQLTSLVSGGPSTVALSRSTFEQDLNDRACHYREFFRKTKIYENWGIR